jgi:hypothetical protein
MFTEAEQILAEVAVFVRPQAGKQGYFQLKPECVRFRLLALFFQQTATHAFVCVDLARYWNEFDPYFLHFTQADLNLATENYHVAIKGLRLLCF